MLAFILPPFLVVCALAVLSYLFFRKLPEVERRELERSSDSLAPFLSITDRLKRLFLVGVERLARSFKLLSLKIHNKLTTLAASARAARLRAVERIAERKRLRAEEKAGHIPFEPKAVRDAALEEEKEAVKEMGPGTSKSLLSASPESAPLVVSGADDRASRLRRWFGKNRESEGVSSQGSASSPRREAANDSLEGETLPPLVSEPLQPMPAERVEREVRRRAADIGRKFGDAVRRFRPEKKPPILPRVVEVPPIHKKDQLEDILVERISINPRDIEAYERLGDYYLEQDNLVDAKECYRQVLKLSPAYRLVKIKIRRLERLLEKERTP